MANTNLGNAKAAKNDEFYTQYADIEKEMQAYLDYDLDVFRGEDNSSSFAMIRNGAISLFISRRTSQGLV